MFNLNKSRKKEKAQVIVLDIVFALTLIILVLFLLFKFSETSIYKTNNQNNLKELESVGDSVYNKFISNPKVNCYVDDGFNSFLINNCIANDSLVTRQNLNIPSNYKCLIIGLPTGVINECTDLLPLNQKEVYNMDFLVSTNTNRSLSKHFYINNGLSHSVNINLKVWKE